MFFLSSNHYNALEQSKRLSYIQDIAIGDFGVTRIGEDARWCRARVVSHEEDDRIRALDVDSGNLDIKFIDEFFPLDQRFVELPARAVACTLSEVRSAGRIKMKIIQRSIVSRLVP